MSSSRRIALILLLACTSAEPAGGQPKPAPPPASQPAAPATAGWSVPAPYFTSGPTAPAAAAFSLGRWQEARDGFAAILAAPGLDAPTRARLTYLVARCDAKLGKAAAAAAGFDAALVDLPLLADWIRYDAANAYYSAGDLARAKERALAVAADSIPYAEARLIVGDVLRAGGDAQAIAAHYEKYLADYPKGIRVAEATFRLAEAREKLGEKQKAVELFRGVAYRFVLSRWGRDAQKRLEALVKTYPKKKRAGLLTPTADELLARAGEYFDGMRNPESEADYRALLARKKLAAAVRCEAAYNLAQSVFKQRQRARSAPLFDEAQAACQKAKNDDLETRAAYQAGRGYGSGDEPKKAIARFEVAESLHPDHSFADDARLRQAEQWEILERGGEAGAGDKMVQVLSTLPTLHPGGDMVGEALWRLAWRAYKAGRYDETLAWLEREEAAVPHDDSYSSEGQVPYFRGRALEKLGRLEEARRAWADTARRYPLSYYALLALNRLREGAPAEFDKLMAELRGDGKPAPLVLRDWPVYHEPGFVRAVELLRLGLGQEAERELGKVGLRVPRARDKVTDPDQLDRLWGVALLYDRAGRYAESHWVGRWAALDYKLAWPVGPNRAKWELAYPRAWLHLVDAATAEQASFPADLLQAHIREESAFDPLMESFANAIGLTQMIFPTAERFGKGLGFDITRENLRDPQKNVAIGSRFLAFLWRTFSGRPALTIPAYNAGEGAVWKWLCQRGTWPQDEFAEQIPYDETRNYSKRVLSSYFVYQYLRDGTVPVVPNDIPPEVINQKKCPTPPASAPASAPALAPAVDKAEKPDKPEKKPAKPKGK